MNNYDQAFGIEKICEMMMNLIEICVSTRTNWNSRYWPGPTIYKEQNRGFLKKIERYCLEHKCSTNEQRELLLNTTRKVWNFYINSKRNKNAT